MYPVQPIIKTIKWRVLHMAYKFQTLAARMSGSLTQEGDVLVFDHSNNEKASIGCFFEIPDKSEISSLYCPSFFSK